MKKCSVGGGCAVLGRLEALEACVRNESKTTHHSIKTPQMPTTGERNAETTFLRVIRMQPEDVKKN